MDSFDPKNETALEQQLAYRGVGNPPQSHPSTAVGNFYPGLEFNFLNVWKRIFAGLHLLESSGHVLEIFPEEGRGRARDQLAELQALKKDEGAKVYLCGIEYQHNEGSKTVTTIVDLLTYAKGPAFDSQPAEPNPELSHAAFMEWGNALAHMHACIVEPRKVRCHFLYGTTDEESDTTKWEKFGPVRLDVRRLIARDDAGETAVISRETSQPGDITESLCSPWQTDYVGCACFYWASNRPDFVNIEPVKVRRPKSGGRSLADDTLILGQHWLDVPVDADSKAKREAGTGRIPRSTQTVTLAKDGRRAEKPFYTITRKFGRKGKLLKHEDVLRHWEDKFEFIIKGQDSPDGVASGKPDKPFVVDGDHIGPGVQGTARVQGEGAHAGLPDHRAGCARKIKKK